MAKEKICGVYKITSPVNKVYVGQSVNIHKRWGDYRGLHNCNEQYLLYNSFKKYGVSEHKFEILQACSPIELDAVEKHYVELFNCLNREFGLNIRHAGGYKKHSKETIEKIRVANIGKKMSPEARRKMSEWQKGKEPWNKGLKGSQVAWNKGKTLSPDHIEKTRIANTGRKDSDETRLKKSLAAKGKKRPVEISIKIGLAQRGKFVSQETREKLRLSHLGCTSKMKGKNHTEESKVKMSISHKGQPAWNKGLTGIYSDEVRAKMALAALGKPVPEERRNKISQTMRGRTFSESHKENLRIAALKRKEK